MSDWTCELVLRLINLIMIQEKHPLEEEGVDHRMREGIIQFFGQKEHDHLQRQIEPSQQQQRLVDGQKRQMVSDQGFFFSPLHSTPTFLWCHPLQRLYNWDPLLKKYI